MIKHLLALLLVTALSALSAAAQVKQSGNVTPGHPVMWTTSGVIQDGGTAVAGALTGLGVTNNGGPGICVNSAAITLPYNRLCLAVSTAGAATLSLQNYNGASAQPLNFVVNGSTISIPASGAGTSFATYSGTPAINAITTFTSTTAGNISTSGLFASAGAITGGAWQATPISLTYGGCGGTSATTCRSNLGLGSLALQNAGTVAITGGTITGMPLPTLSSDVATKAYADGIAAGIIVLAPSNYATAAVLPNTPTYANGSSGVGATLTAGSNAALVVDGVSVSVTNRILVKNQAAPAQNGIYTVTTAGNGGTPWVLTRATDFDTSAEMVTGSYTFITAGNTNINSAYTLQSAVAVVGTNAVNFTLFSATTGVASIGGLTGTISCAASITCSGGAISTNASIVPYTPSGTGGAATTVKAELDRTIWVNDYGAACNGSTDDTTAFQNAINQGQSTGYNVRFTGTCKVNSQLTISSNLNFSGSGIDNSFLYSGNLAGTTIVVNTTSAVYLHDFTISYSSAASAGSYMVYVTAPGSSVNSGSKFERLNFANSGGKNCLAFINAAYWTLANSQLACDTNAVYVSDVPVPDAGDSAIYGNLIQAGPGGVGIIWTSSGGLRITNNKILGNSMNQGILVELASGAVTTDMMITSNSIEGITTSGGSGILFNRIGATGTFGNVTINSNQIAAAFCVYVPTDANGVWITSMVINGNICQGNGVGTVAGFAVDSVQGLNIIGNQNQSQVAGMVGVAVGSHGPTATNCVIAYNTKVGGGFAASAPGSCTAVAPY